MSEEQKKEEQDEFKRWVDGLDVNETKKKFLIAFKALFGNIAGSCRAAGIVRQTFYNWKVDDPKFLQAWSQIEPKEDFLDALEAEMKKCAMIDKNPTMMIFLAKTQGKERGYIERNEQVISGNKIDVHIKGEDEPAA